MRYEAASTSYCGQMGIERERTLQMKLSKFALKVRGGEEGEKAFTCALCFCSAVKSRIQVHRARFSEITTQ